MLSLCCPCNALQYIGCPAWALKDKDTWRQGAAVLQSHCRGFYSCRVPQGSKSLLHIWCNSSGCRLLPCAACDRAAARIRDNHAMLHIMRTQQVGGYA